MTVRASGLAGLRGMAMVLDETLAGAVIVLYGATRTEVARLGGEMNAAARREHERCRSGARLLAQVKS